MLKMVFNKYLYMVKYYKNILYFIVYLIFEIINIIYLIFFYIIYYTDHISTHRAVDLTSWQKLDEMNKEFDELRHVAFEFENEYNEINKEKEVARLLVDNLKNSWIKQLIDEN